MAKKSDKPESQTTDDQSRRTFFKTAVGAAVATGTVGAGGAAHAHKAGLKGLKKDSFVFSSRIEPEALTKQNIQQISDAIAKTMAREANAAIQKGIEPDNFHIRFGGGHSRSHSKTADHKNVTHSNTIVTGSGDI